MNDLAAFFAGAFLCNSLPHLVCGLKGEPFPTPFAKPRGVGDSSPLVNFLWGFFNLMAGIALATWPPIQVGLNAGFLALIVGVLLIGLHLSRHFGKVRPRQQGR
ncbi:hypothetical protein [Variovorax terrae]|uniref:Uncharacterized protein n=1 Tax=Variovorax terrae TaxID=2923278 RepID=A0A9X2AP09_9BURK|nr:hypothetical protein [Variovorax terrae]MCJ0764360.1 hypothetical protein [Variovorax terrae]